MLAQVFRLANIIHMKDLTIFRVKPNPIGKDKLGNNALNSQLVGEWVDIKNTSGKKLNMVGVEIYDHTFNNFCGDQGKRKVYTFGSYSMPIGAVVRIHSGNKVPITSLNQIDRVGANAHAFTGYYYVWNNGCGDIAEVRNSEGVLIDKASYGARPTEGKILVRVADMLI